MLEMHSDLNDLRDLKKKIITKSLVQMGNASPCRVQSSTTAAGHGRTCAGAVLILTSADLQREKSFQLFACK